MGGGLTKRNSNQRYTMSEITGLVVWNLAREVAPVAGVQGQEWQRLRQHHRPGIECEYRHMGNRNQMSAAVGVFNTLDGEGEGPDTWTRVVWGILQGLHDG
jgi:hypothetical protein